MADNTDEESSGDESPDTTSDATELTPEQRDEQTIARAFGLDQADEEPDNESESEESEEDESEEDETSSDETEDEEEELDEESESEDETEDEDETEESESDEAASGEESDADDEDTELTEDDVNTFLDAVTEDRLLEHPRLVERLKKVVQAQVDSQFAQRMEATELSQETERLIKQGAAAADEITSLFANAGEYLAKVVAGKEVSDDEEVVLDPEKLKGNLEKFAVASALKTRQGYDQAFASSFRQVAPLTGEAFNEDEAKAILNLVQTADRIRKDPEQGEAAANTYLFTESTKFLVERARAAGKADAEAARKKRNEAAKRVIGSKNTDKAALAKVANKRKKLPKKSPKSDAKETESAPSMDAYRAAKLAGKPEEADRIMAAMQAAGMGQPVPDSEQRIGV